MTTRQTDGDLCAVYPAPDGGWDDGSLDDGTGLAEARDVWRQGDRLCGRPGWQETEGEAPVLATACHEVVFHRDDQTFADGKRGRRGAAVRQGGSSVSWYIDIVRFDNDGGRRVEGTVSVVTLAGEPTVNFVPAGSGMLDPADGETEQMMFVRGGQILRRDDAGQWVSAASAIYEPLTVEDGRGQTAPVAPTGLTPREGRNLLTAGLRGAFTTDGRGAYFFLPFDHWNRTTVTVTYDDGTDTHTASVAGNQTTAALTDEVTVRIDREGGYVCFQSDEFPDGGHVLPSAGRRNNLQIRFEKAVDGGRRAVTDTRFCAWFNGTRGEGSRLFVGGNPDQPHRIYWSAPNRPLYFPEEANRCVGGATQAVTGMAQQGNWLVVFKEHELYALTATVGGLSLTPLNGTVGCDCPHTVRLCDGRLTWLTGDGQVYTLARSRTYNAGNVRCVTGAAAAALAADSRHTRQKAVAAWWRGYYLLLVGGKVFALHQDNPRYRHAVMSATPPADATTPWYGWTVPDGMTCLYLAADDRGVSLLGEQAIPLGRRLCAFALGDDDGTPACVATTPLDSGRPETDKVVEAIDLYVKGKDLTVEIDTAQGWYTVLAAATARDRLTVRPGGRRARTVAVRLTGRELVYEGLAVHTRALTKR